MLESLLSFKAPFESFENQRTKGVHRTQQTRNITTETWIANSNFTWLVGKHKVHTLHQSTSLIVRNSLSRWNFYRKFVGATFFYYLEIFDMYTPAVHRYFIFHLLRFFVRNQSKLGTELANSWKLGLWTECLDCQLSVLIVNWVSWSWTECLDCELSVLIVNWVSWQKLRHSPIPLFSTLRVFDWKISVFLTRPCCPCYAVLRPSKVQ